MQYTYEQYFDKVLDHELQQKKDGGDRAGKEKFRYLRKEDSQRYINTAIRELVLQNKDRYYAEVTVQLFDPRALTLPSFGAPEVDGILYVDSREALSSDLKTLKLPPNVAELIAVQAPNGRWVHLTQSSAMQKDMRITASGTVKREDGWDLENITEGEASNSFKAQVILFPVWDRIWNISDFTTSGSTNTVALDGLEGLRALEMIRIAPDNSDTATDNWDQLWRTEGLDAIVNAPASYAKDAFTWDLKPVGEKTPPTTAPVPGLSETWSATYDFSDIEVPFPIEFERLLTLTIKKNAYARKNKPLSTYEFADLKELERRWQLDGGQIKSKVVIPLRGHGFGRRRR
jgi:hypothetical protein